jgi:hypothetical protein
MKVPKVIEVRRGSVHRATAPAPISAAAPRAHHDGGSRWNSGI